MSAEQLLFYLLEDGDMVALAQCRLERKDNLAEVVVFALQGLDRSLELMDLALIGAGDEKVLAL